MKTENLEGFEVLVFEEKAEEDTWTFYVVRPRPDLLLTATNIDYLKTVLSRMKARGKTRSFPENLPEWKQVDLNARFWAIRHYDPKDTAEDPSSPLREQAAANFPDKEAVGLTFAYNAARGKTAKVIYLSGNKKAADIVSPLWKSEGNVLQPTIRQIVGGVEITVEVEPQKARHLLFVLLSALGHAIYL